MKIRKPNDEKYFKDIVLNDILVEISNENVQDKKTTITSKKNKPFLTRKTFYILSICLILIFTLFNFKPLKQLAPTKVDSKEMNNTQSWKMEKDQNGSHDNESLNIVKKITSERQTSPKEIYTETKNAQPVSTPKPISKPVLTEEMQRELAKEALRQQMLN